MTTWLQHVKQVHAKGSTSFKESLKRASASWKKTKGAAAAKKPAAKKKRRKKKGPAPEAEASIEEPEAEPDCAMPRAEFGDDQHRAKRPTSTFGLPAAVARPVGKKELQREPKAKKAMIQMNWKKAPLISMSVSRIWPRKVQPPRRFSQ